ncbi:hypothetical protein GQ457_16G006540 [Hibiscus cannabinus]
MEVEQKPKHCNLKQAPMEIQPQALHHATTSGGLVIVDAPKKEEAVTNCAGDNDDYLDSFPPGFRFCPLDEELVLHYLKKKVMNLPLPQNRIMEVNLYSYNPEKLAEQHKQYGEKEWYFFTPRDKKYRNGTRPNRAAGDGFWKATGADREIRFNDGIIGYRKALVFYKGRPPRGDKTDWIMHEYRVNDPPPKKERADYNDMRLDDWVLCRIYKKQDKSGRTQTKNEEQVPVIQNPEEPSEEMIGSEEMIDYDEYFNTMGGGLMNQTLAEECLSSYQHIFNEQFSPCFPTRYLNERLGPDDVWNSIGDFELPAQVGVYVEPFVNVDWSSVNNNNNNNNNDNNTNNKKIKSSKNKNDTSDEQDYMNADVDRN